MTLRSFSHVHICVQVISFYQGVTLKSNNLAIFFNRTPVSFLNPEI